MRRVLIVLGGIVPTVLVLAGVAVFVATNTGWGREQLRTRIVSAVNGATHGNVSVGRIDGNLLRGLTLHDVAITDSAGAPFVKASSVSAGYSILPFLSRKIDLSNVRLVDAEILLDKPPGQPWNYERIFPVDSNAGPSDTTGIQFGDWLMLHDVHLVNTKLTVRIPWSPPDSLAKAARDSTIRVALDSTSRSVVVEVAGGYQMVQEFRDINGYFPLMRIAHPDYATRLIEADSLSMTAFAFAPPPAVVQQLRGTFELDADSVWFDVPKLQLPESRLVVKGRYSIESGDMALHAVADRLALRDARFLYPALPAEGTAAFDLALSWVGDKQQYLVHGLDLQTQGATATGEVGITLADTLQIHQTDVTFANVDTHLLEQLIPTLEIPRHGVLSGHAEIDGALTAMQVDGDVTFRDARSGTSRVLAMGEVGTADGVVRTRNLRVTLSPVQVDLAQTVLKDFPLGGTIRGTATLDGATNTRLVAQKFDLTHVQDGERSRFTGSGAVGLGGDVPFLLLDANAEPLSLVTVGRFAPAAQLRGAVAGPLHLEGTTRELAVNSLMRTSDGGSIAAVGTLDLASAEIGYSLGITTVLFNANLLAEKAPQTSLSATLTAEGRGFDPATMVGNFDAAMTTSTIDTLAVDSSRVRVHMASGVMTVDTLSVNVPGAVANITGTFGLDSTATGTLTYAVQVDSVGKLARYLPPDTTVVAPRLGPVAEKLARARADSSRISQRLAVARAAGVAPPARPIVIDTPPLLRRDSLAGSARAEGTLTGNISNFDLEGTLKAAGIIAMGNTVQHAKADYKWTGVMTPDALVDVTAAVDSLSAAGFFLDSVNVKGTYREPGGEAHVSVFQDSRRDYTLNTEYAIYPDRKELKFQDIKFRFDTTHWASTRPGSVLWGQPGIEIEQVDLRNSEGGRIFADGKVPSEGVADFTLTVDKFEVGDIMGLLQSDIALRGLFSVNTRITGSSAAPVIVGSTNLAKSTFGGIPVPNVAGTFNYDNRKLAAKADATYEGLTVAQATALVPVNLATSGVTGSRLLDEPAEIDVRADSLPLDLASRFTSTVSEVRGYATGAASVRGTLKDPKITGDVNMGNAEMRLTDLGVKLLAMNGAVHVRGDSVLLDSLVAFSDGRIAIVGTMGLAKVAEPSFDLHISADRARVLDNEQGKVRADASIDVKGPFDGVVVSGRARIREAVLQIPEPDTREPISAGDPALLAVMDTTSDTFDEVVGSPSPLVNNLRMDLTLAVDRDTWVRSKEANVEIFSDGDLRINIDRRRGALTLDGVVSTDRGEYEFLSKRFQLKRGSATFVGTQDIDPILQFTGEYEVKQAGQEALKIKILIGGTLLEPRLSLESDAQPPISQSDLLSYLAFGSESGSLLQFGGSSVSGSTAGGSLVGTSAALASKQLIGVALGVGVNELEGQGARAFGADVFNITPSNIPPELASGSVSGLTTLLKGTQLEFGKYFTTQTFVGLQLQATTSPGFRVEHRFGDHGLSLESTLQPRYFLPEPSLSTQELKKANALGFFLVRRWKF